MRIGIDLQVLGQRPWTGVGKYVYHLTEALKKLETKHEFVFFGPAKEHIPFITNHFLRVREIQKTKVDMLHGPANVLPLFYRGRSIITIHDLAIYKHPEWFARGQRFSTNFLVPHSIKKADGIIVPSQATKKDLMDIFGVDQGKISVIAHGVEERFYKNQNAKVKMQNYNSKFKKYILFVGTIEPRKNISKLIDAYRGLPQEIRKEHDLVIAGTPPLREGREREGVKFLGYVPDDELPRLYQRASLFVYPSLYEGFGLPVLESLAAGVPVVTSRGTAMEAITGGNGIMVDPDSEEEIRGAIIQVLTNPSLAREMSETGAKKAAEYTWEGTVRKTIKVYESLA